jgi:hypothetical protein
MWSDVFTTLHHPGHLISLLSVGPQTSQQPELDQKSNDTGAKKARCRPARMAKEMLMRVGFEPTPFRTSDFDVPEGNTLS